MIELVVPLGQPRVEHAGVGDLHRLPVIGRGHRRLVAESPSRSSGRYFRKTFASATRASNAVEEPAIGQFQRHRAPGRPESRAASRASASRTSGPGLLRRRLAVGQIDDADLVALFDQLGERAAAGDLDVVRMGSDGNQIEFVRRCGRSWDSSLWSSPQELSSPSDSQEGRGSKVASPRNDRTAFATR